MSILSVVLVLLGIGVVWYVGSFLIGIAGVLLMPTFDAIAVIVRRFRRSARKQ